MLGELYFPLSSHSKRRLLCSLTILVNRHIETVEAQLKLNQIPNKTHQLKEKWHYLDTQLRETQLNKMCELSTEMLINDENKCRKFRTDEVDYSPETNETGKM